MKLYHVSDRGDIRSFVPRPPPSSAYPMLRDDVVWAIDRKHLPNYMLPRDCPRVCFYPTVHSSDRDRKRFIGNSPHPHVIAIEDSWVQRAIKDPIWVYELPSDPFVKLDPGAGYFVSRQTVRPLNSRLIRYPLTMLEGFDVSLRVVEDLSELQDGIVSSSLQYSCIRMRNTKSKLSGVA